MFTRCSVARYKAIVQFDPKISLVALNRVKKQTERVTSVRDIYLRSKIRKMVLLDVASFSQG